MFRFGQFSAMNRALRSMPPVKSAQIVRITTSAVASLRARDTAQSNSIYNLAVQSGALGAQNNRS
jgi:hypothetical protein